MLNFILMGFALELLGKLTLKLVPWIMGKMELMRKPAKFKRGDVIVHKQSPDTSLHWRVTKVSPARMEYYLVSIEESKFSPRWDSIAWTDEDFEVLEFYDSPLAAVMREDDRLE